MLPIVNRRLLRPAMFGLFVLLVVLSGNVVFAQQDNQTNASVFVGQRGILIVEADGDAFRVGLNAQVRGLDAAPSGPQVAIQNGRAVLTNDGSTTFQGRRLTTTGVEGDLNGFERTGESLAFEGQNGSSVIISPDVEGETSTVTVRNANGRTVTVRPDGLVTVGRTSENGERRVGARGRPSGNGNNVVLTNSQNRDANGRPSVNRANPSSSSASANRPQGGQRTPDGENADGLQFFDNPDGSFYMYDPVTGETTLFDTEGNAIPVEVNPDGSTTFFEPDGSVTIVDPNGNAVNVDEDDEGNVLLTDGDGNQIILGNDGTILATDPENPDAFVEILDVAPDGTVLFEDENGLIVERSPDGEENVLVDEDGEPLAFDDGYGDDGYGDGGYDYGDYDGYGDYDYGDGDYDGYDYGDGDYDYDGYDGDYDYDGYGDDGYGDDGYGDDGYDDGYGDDGYGDDGYGDDGYGDDGYGDDGYGDDGYDDGYGDDGYGDDGYDDGGYDDGGDDGYDDGGYDDDGGDDYGD